MSNATKAQTKASEAYVEAIDKRVDSELAESHNAQRQSFWKDQKSRRILGDVLTYVPVSYTHLDVYKRQHRSCR